MSQDQIVSTYRTEADGACLQLSSVLVTPLDEQIGKIEKENVPADLLHPLFGMSATETSAAGPDRQFATFVLLDAAKIPNLPELLSNSDVEHCCLFQGPNLGQLGNVSPWLAKIAKEDRLTRNFCTSSDAPWHFWRREAGIFIRSPLSLEQLRRHLKKFVRVPFAPKRWAMLRFWDPAVAKEYFAAIADQTDQASAWGGGAKSAISRLVIPEPRAVTVVEFPTTEQQGRFPPVIDERVRLRFRQLALMRNIALLEEVIEAPRWLGIETPEVRQLVCRVIELGTRYGISGRRDIARLCNVALQLGHRFPEDVRFERWARGALADRAVAENVRVRTCYDRAIVQLRADGSPGARLKRLTALLETLERGTRPGTYEACRTVLGSPDTVETYQLLSAFSEESLALHAATATVRWPEEVLCAFSSCFGQYFKDDPSRKTWSALLEEAATIAELRSQVADRVNRWVTQYDAV